MERLLGWRFWTTTVVGYVISVSTWANGLWRYLKTTFIDFEKHVPPALQGFGDFAPPLLLGLIVGFLFLKPVWRCIWRAPAIGPWLANRCFPDLNGEWEAEYLSNWARIDAMRNAARDAAAPRYDWRASETVALGPIMKLRATIDQGWGRIKMTMKPLGEDDKIKESVTIAFDLLRGRDNVPQLAYVYEQENKIGNLDPADEEDFRGAAFLTVKDDGRRMEGHYFTARAWRSGLNTAGTIVFRKLD